MSITMPDGLLSVVKSGKQSEFEWKIDHFSLSKCSYWSPLFKFEGECWYLQSFHNDGYMDLRLCSLYACSPIDVELSVSVKTTNGMKNFERRERKCFEGKNLVYDIVKWINRSEFTNREREFLSSGCLTILITMQKAQYEKETQTDSDASICSCCKENIDRDKISFHKDCLGKASKCPKCHEDVSLPNWFDHVCQMENAPADSDAPICSSCKENIDGDKISFHKDCLGKASKCPKCNKEVSLPNWFDHVCQMENAPGESSTAQTSGSRHKDKTLQDLKKLFLNQENFDVVLSVQGEEFSAHQAILTARSPVFASTFRSNMREKETGTVEINDIDPSCFPEFLCFLYCGDVDKLSTENVRNLFSAADKYQIMDLRTMCLEFMKDNVTVETFCDTLALALLHTETELIDACTDYFVRNAEEILITVKWQIFAAENPTQSTELFIKHVKHVKQFIK